MKYHRFLALGICLAVVWNDYCSVTCLTLEEKQLKYAESLEAFVLRWATKSDAKRLVLAVEIISTILDGAKYLYEPELP